MSTVTNWEERCYRCGNDTRFHYHDAIQEKDTTHVAFAAFSLPDIS